MPELARLETFDAGVFQGNEEYPQELCDLMLSLALAYNDLRDTSQGLILLIEIQNELGPLITPQMGLVGGLKNSLTRVQMGFVRELLFLLKTHQSILEHPTFQQVQRQLSKSSRESWSALLDAANERETKNPLTKTLNIIRHKVSFHYDAEQLGRGYSEAFYQHTEVPTYKAPLISRGSRMSETRFHFADAAAQAYMNARVSNRDAMEFVNATGGLLGDINQALYHLITTFINARSPWKEYRSHA